MGSNSRMTGQITSQSAQPLSAPSIREEWSTAVAFWRRPALPEQMSPLGAGWRASLRLLVLDLLLLIAFVIAATAVEVGGYKLPTSANQELPFTLGVFALVVIVIPIAEELAFRSWLSGQPGPIVALACVLAGGALYWVVSGEGLLAALPFLACGIVGAAIALILMRGRPAMSWFRRWFPVLFWLSSVSFALIHLYNYSEGAAVVLLPMLFPQLMLGMIAGYARVHYGLMWAFFLHGAHNGFAFGVAWLSQV